jgi:hypothetical protein
LPGRTTKRAKQERAAQAERDSMLEIASFILKKQRERLESIRVRYILDDEEDEQDASQASLGSRAQGTVPSLHRSPQARQSCTSKAGELLRVKVLSVQAGHSTDAGAVDDEDDGVPPDFGEMIGPDSTFSFNNKNRGHGVLVRARERVLTLKLQRAVTLPREGELSCEDVAQRTSLDRQDKAITTFKADEAVNPRLPKLLMTPEVNTLDERVPLDLVQPDLEPADDVADLVSRAMAASDLFLLQGPAGHGQDHVHHRGDLPASPPGPLRPHPADLAGERGGEQRRGRGAGAEQQAGESGGASCGTSGKTHAAPSPRASTTTSRVGQGDDHTMRAGGRTAPGAPRRDAA